MSTTRRGQDGRDRDGSRRLALLGPLRRTRTVGEQASPRDAVCIDMWDDYLEHASFRLTATSAR
jgi:hypothetical protein